MLTFKMRNGRTIQLVINDIMALLPDSEEIMTKSSWTVQVDMMDWPKVKAICELHFTSLDNIKYAQR